MLGNLLTLVYDLKKKQNAMSFSCLCQKNTAPKTCQNFFSTAWHRKTVHEIVD